MLQTHDKIFIYGIGGIGKSEFVKQYISDHKKEYTNILYMTYSGSLKSTIASLDFHDDKSRDSVDTRFYRHNIFLKHLKNDSLIIIDNFDIMPDMDDHLEEIHHITARSFLPQEIILTITICLSFPKWIQTLLCS